MRSASAYYREPLAMLRKTPMPAGSKRKNSLEGFMEESSRRVRNKILQLKDREVGGGAPAAQ